MLLWRWRAIHERELRMVASHRQLGHPIGIRTISGVLQLWNAADVIMLNTLAGLRNLEFSN
jgi:hypothetical protein